MPRAPLLQRRHLFAPALALLLLGTTSFADVFTWTGSGADLNWTTPANWNPAATPANDGTATISFKNAPIVNPTIDVPWSINALNFDSNAGAFYISGNSLTIGAGGISNQNSQTQTFYNPLVLSADQTWNSASSGYIQSWGDIDIGNHTLTLTGTGMVGTRGTITGTAPIIVNLTGSTFALFNANYCTGAIFLNGGRLYAGSDKSLSAPADPIVFNGGSLALDRGTTINRNLILNTNASVSGFLAQYENVTLAGTIQGPGALYLDAGGAGEFTIAATNNSYAGGTFMSNGYLIGTTNTLKGAINLANIYSVVHFSQDFNGTFAGNITGGGALQKYGSGIVTLTGNNTFTSDTELYAGTLEVTASAGLSPNSRLCFEGGGAVVQFVGGATFAPSVAKTIFNGAGGFSARDGKLIVNIGGAGAQIHMYPSTTFVFGSPTANDVTEFKNSLDVGAGISSPSPTLQVNAGAGGDYAIASGVISNSNAWAKTGPGTLQLTGQNTYTGALQISAGAVQAVEGVGIPTASNLLLAGGVFLSAGPASFTRALGTGAGQVRWAYGSGGGGFASGGGVFTVNIGGASQTLTWGAINSISSGYPLVFGASRAAGQVLFQNPIALGTPTREIRVDPGLGQDFATLSGALSGTGSLKKTGAGRLQLTGANTYTGATTVAAGILDVDGALAKTALSVQPGATLTGTGTIAGTLAISGGSAPASAGSIDLTDGQPAPLILTDSTATDVALSLGNTSAGAFLTFEVGSTADSIRITTARLLVNPGGASISIVPLAGFAPGTYDILDFPAGNATGLDNLRLSTTSLSGYCLALQSTPTAELLQVIAVPEPATLSFLIFASATLLSRRRKSTSLQS